MSGPVKRFIYASLFYFAVGAVLGFLQAINPFWVSSLRFSHVHLLLLGFMAMMVYGIGYFILPRFTSTSLIWPGLVSIHFWVANLGLIGMVVFKPLGQAFSSPLLTGLFYAAAVSQVLGVFMFVTNLGITLITAPEPRLPMVETKKTASTPATSRPQPARPALPELTHESPVADWIDRKEGARELLVEAGLRPVADPAHLDMVRKIGVTLGTACTKHGMPLGEILDKLSALPDRPVNLSPAGAQGTAATAPTVSGAFLTIQGASSITQETVIGQMVESFPATRTVLEARFGSGCFTCPGFATETLAQGAAMHGVEVNALVHELKSAAGRSE